MQSNLYLYLGDLCYYTATAMLLIRFIRNKSCAGFSGKMQIVYAMVFTTSSLNVGYGVIGQAVNQTGITLYSIYYIEKAVMLSFVHYLILYLMYRRYTKTLERDFDKFWIEAIIIFSFCFSLLKGHDISSPWEVIEDISTYMEALVIIPQIYFTYKSEQYDKVVSLYILILNLASSSWIIHYSFHYDDSLCIDPFKLYSCVVSLVIGMMYFVLIFALKKEKAKPETILPFKRPPLMHQQSLLESPFLKRSMPSSSSLYTISLDVDGGSSIRSTPSGSVKDLKIEGRY